MANRATAAEIKILFGGDWPAGADDTNVAALEPGIDYKLDGYVKLVYKVTLSTTDTDVIHIANMMGKQVVLDMIWSQAGGSASQTTGLQPVIFTEEIKSLIKAVVGSQTYDGLYAGDTISNE